MASVEEWKQEIMMDISRITQKGQVTLPASIRRRFGMKTGDTVGFVLTDAGILVKPVEIVDKTEHIDWKSAVQEARKDVEAGRTTFYPDNESFLKSLG